MATFVLVHGAWGGGWCWKDVAPLLRATGHDVYTPTLTGVGERAHLLNPTIDLRTHVQDYGWSLCLDHETPNIRQPAIMHNPSRWGPIPQPWSCRPALRMVQ